MVMGPDDMPVSRQSPVTDVVLVVAATGQSDHRGQAPSSQVLAGVAGLLLRAVSAGEQAAATVVNAALDRAVPLLVNAVLDRVDLTQLVLDRVDIDRIVARADLEEIIDRIPLLQLADYIVEEIDLPSLIRESTGGIAVDAVDVLRMQSFGADRTVSRLMDAILRRRSRLDLAGSNSAPPDPQADAR
jgi:hypothetical protein